MKEKKRRRNYFRIVYGLWNILYFLKNMEGY